MTDSEVVEARQERDFMYADQAETKSDVRQADEPARETEVRYVVDGLGRTVSDVAELVGLLEQRLQHVLREAGPEEAGSDIARAIQTKHASELSDIDRRARMARDGLRSVLDRLEI